MGANCIFEQNPVLISMEMNPENIIVRFRKYSKKYYGIPIEIAYKFFYSKQPLTFFNEHIKNKYKNEKI